VVTRQEVFDDYHRELPENENLRILTAETGGDTALTLLIAWRSCQTAGIACSHFWAHPVDLPLVKSGVINFLMDHSRRHPERIIRPVHQGTPGHPVILPRDVLANLDGMVDLHSGPLRNFLSTTGGSGMLPGPMMVEVGDPGIIRDFDRPEDFLPHQSSAMKDDNHE